MYLRSLAHLLAICATLAAIVCLPASVQAASISVSTTADELNSDGDCSLREAIRAANRDQVVDRCAKGSGDDTITLGAATYAITLVGPNEDDTAAGDFDLRNTLTIRGAGEGRTIVDGYGEDRIFDIRGGAFVTLIGMTIQAGRESDGGGVRNVGTLIIEHCTIRNNEGFYGGGFHNANIATINDSSIANNNSSSGGAIFNEGRLTLNTTTLSTNYGDTYGGGITNIGTLFVKNQSIIRNNVSPGESEASGGGMYNTGEATVSDSTISENNGDWGGGIYNDLAGKLTVNNSNLTRNTTSSDLESIGGGIANYGSMTLSNANISSNVAGYGVGLGGGIYNRGTATLTSSTVANNTATTEPYYNEPGVAGGGIWNNGTLTLNGGTISGNRATVDGAGPNGIGGGVFNSGTLTVQSTTIRENETALEGGGVFNQNKAKFTNAIIRNNHSHNANGGGGILNTSEASILGSSVRDNVSDRNGGGVLNRGKLTITSTSMRGNVSEGSGGAIANEAGTIAISKSTIEGNKIGGGVWNTATMTVDASTINGNAADFQGGGFANLGTLTLTNSTVSGNQAEDSGGGIRNQGTLTLASVTIFGNETQASGGGISSASGSATLRNTIVAGNIASDPGADCAGTLVSQGYNLLQSTTGCTIGGTTTGNVVGRDPQLGGLTSNGGPTKTHSLPRTSPAIDAANPASSGATTCPSTDQRASKRPRDGNGDGTARCDIGAYER